MTMSMKTMSVCALSATLKMRQVLLAVLAVLCLVQAVAAEQDRPGRILVLHSYHQGLEWTDAIQREIGRVFAQAKADVELDIHYLDMARLGPVIGRKGVEDGFLLHIARLHHDLGYDLVLVTDNDALDMILRHRETIAPGAPVVFCGVNNFSQSMLGGQPGVTGVAETPSFDKTFELARTLLPGLKKVLVLGEDTPTGQLNLALLQAQLQNAPFAPELHFSTQTDITALEARLAGLSPEWAVLPMCRPFEGSRLLSVPEASARLSKASQVPLLAAWDFWMNHGPLGGVMVSATSQGGAAAGLALRILRGEPADSIPVLADSPNLAILDQNALDRFSLSPARVPRDAVILNRVPSFYDQHRTLVWTYGLMSLAGTGLCLLLAFNVAARRKAEISLKRQLLFTETLLRAMPAPVFYKDSSGRYLGCNKAFADFHGLCEEEVRGRSVYDLFPGSQGAFYDEKDRQLLQSEGVQCYDHRLQTKGGQRDVIICKSVFSDEQGHPAGIVGIITDITDRKAMELELVAVRDAAMAASQAKSAFLANMSHEIRTPLNGIMGMLQLLETSALTDEQRKFIGLAVVAGQRLTVLLSDILDISRIEAGKLPLTMRPFDLEDMRAAVETLFSIPARDKGLALHVELDDDLPPRVIGDELRLRQILFNLVGNAIKFTDAGFVRLEISTLPASRGGECRILCCVSDSGQGIDDESLSEIFEPFVQGEGTHVRHHQGAGLGLSIVSRLVHMMGGALAIDNSETGTTICLSLPLQMPAQEDGDEVRRERDDQPSLAGLRILLAEDDAVNMFAAVRILENAGHAVTQAKNGQEALELLRGQDFDLVLMDIQMPVMDGVQATTAIRSDPDLGDKSRIPIVAMTAYAMTGDRDKFLACGMDDYVSKPLDAKALGRLIDDVVARKNACPLEET